MENEHNKIPKTLNECYEIDEVSEHLWSWSDRLERYGQTLFVICIIVGIVSTIITTIKVGDTDSDMVLLAAIECAVKWIFTAFIEYCIYNILSLLVASLASLVQNTNITANVSLYNAAKTEKNTFLGNIINNR